MKRLFSAVTTLFFVLPVLASAAPGDRRPDRPTTKPAFGARPVGERPGNNRPPPSPPGQRPPPMHRPPRPSVSWHKPRPNQWYWGGNWVNRIRGPAFVYPRGYAYRHWSAGDFLPALFLTAAYFYDNVQPLGLEIPPPGYRWVRYGPDLLLINVRTRSVEQVAYGVFY